MANEDLTLPFLEKKKKIMDDLNLNFLLFAK